MIPRPMVFISAVSKELRSARQLVANTLQFLGYEPVWQDIFGTEQGDLRQVLREKIDGCKGVVQLVGQCYGARPFLDEEFWSGRSLPDEWLDELTAMDPAERQLVLDELAGCITEAFPLTNSQTPVLADCGSSVCKHGEL